MMRRFNTAGHCLPEQHYMLPPEDRLSGAIRPLIEQGLYFVLHAPRQSGKTTLLRLVAAALQAEGHFTALATSVEELQKVADPDQANLLFLERLSRDSRRLPEAERPPAGPPEGQPRLALGDRLSRWSRQNAKPVVLFLDEIDCLVDEVLINFLRQLRVGYSSRPDPFPHSVALVGLRDVRDYKVQLRPDMVSMGTASPFNIKAESLTLRSFTPEEVARLYAQHTGETNQPFAPEACARAWEWTRGQPWLVNALARQIVEKDLTDRRQVITAEHVEAARNALILRRDTHLDSLVDKLREPRVRRVIEPILVGAIMTPDVLNDDLAYVRDLGLIETSPQVRLANPIYQEVIPRALTAVLQANIAQEMAWYERPDGSLDMTALLEAFQEFFAEQAEAWQRRFDYQEAGPHLILMAFLQRLVNGGGRITREFAIGSGRVDLVIHWKRRRYVLELKIRRSPGTIEQGVRQLSRYLDRLGEDEGWLVVFDPRDTVSWEEKLYDQQQAGPDGKTIHIFGA